MPKKKLLVKTITINGKRVYFYGHSQSEIAQKMVAYTQKSESGKLLKDVISEWQAWHDPLVAYSTAHAYNYPCKQISALMGDIGIKKIKPEEIKIHLVSLAEQNYSAKIIKRYLSIYSQVFDYAVEKGYTELNVARQVSMPRIVKKAEKRIPVTPEQEKIIAQYSDTYLLPYFLMMTGCRRGEALCLQWKDISDDVIHVTKSLRYDAGKPTITLPKTQAGIRDIPLLADLKAKLHRGDPDDYVFGRNGKPIYQNTFYREWDKFQSDTGLDVSPHQLRHTFATMCYESGLDIKQSAMILGHADEHLTQSLYEHIRQSKQEDAVSKLNNYLAKK